MSNVVVLSLALASIFRQPPSKLRACGISDGAGVGGAIQYAYSVKVKYTVRLTRTDNHHDITPRSIIKGRFIMGRKSLVIINIF